MVAVLARQVAGGAVTRKPFTYGGSETAARASYGIPTDNIFAKDHRSNLSKVLSDSVVRYRADSKVLESPTFSPPDLGRLLQPDPLGR